MDSPGKSTAVGCLVLLQGIFLTQGSKSGLLHCRQTLNGLSYQGSPPAQQQNSHSLLKKKKKKEKEKENKESFVSAKIFISKVSLMCLGLSGGSAGKESACNVGDLSLISGLGRSPRGGHGNPLQYSCLENPMDRGAWRTTVPGVTNIQT